MRTGLTTLALLATLLFAFPQQQPVPSLPQPAQQSAQPPAPVPNYTIEAIRYANVRAFPLSSLVMGAPPEKRVDIAMIFWLIRGGGRNILFDCGFHRPSWIAKFRVADFLSPAEAAREAGLEPSLITDIIVSHAHWDHMGSLDLFPNATIWIQKAEYEYYTGEAWQPGGRKGGIDPEDVTELVARNLRGQVRLIPGDDVEILPGIRVFTGARHTFASQYVRVAGDEPFVLASDNCYLYANLLSRRASATFDPADAQANVAALFRMVQLAGSPDRVVPGHDPDQFGRFPTHGRVARLR